MTHQTPWDQWEATAKAADIHGLRYMILDCRAAANAMKDHNPEREGFYIDQAFTYSDELRRRMAKV